MPYRLRIAGRAHRELGRLPPEVIARIQDAIDALAVDPRPPACIKLRGGAGWRIRIGDYRVVYDVDDDAQTVTVLRAGHRRDVYRNL
jgi:mRNA interferase RelE/StbE